MKGRDLLRELERQAVLVLPTGELPAILESWETLREEDTGISGPIRVLSLEGRIAVQEQGQNTKEIFLRGFPSPGEAERFVEERMSTYERMWDGCGCKIDYHG